MTLSAHPLTNFEIQQYYQNEPRFNGVFSTDNLPNKITNGAYVINLICSFGVEHIPKEIMKFTDRKKIITNIYRMQTYDSIMCGYFCIGFINFMFNDKSLTDYTNLFSPNNFKKKDDIILNYFGLQDVKMSNSNLELNDLTAELSAKHVTKYRLDEINKIKIT